MGQLIPHRIGGEEQGVAEEQGQGQYHQVSEPAIAPAKRQAAEKDHCQEVVAFGRREIVQIVSGIELRGIDRDDLRRRDLREGAAGLQVDGDGSDFPVAELMSSTP